MTAPPVTFSVSARRGLTAALQVPPDKSVSHRALMFAGLAEGETVIRRCLLADDCRRTKDALARLGASYVPLPGSARHEASGSDDRSGAGAGDFRVRGRGLRLSPPDGPIDLGNSGTSMRLLLGVLAGQPFAVTLTGDESLSRRPMRRVVDPLRDMGAVIDGPDGANHAPLTVRGGRLRAIQYRMPVPSAQVKSAILLAGLYADAPTQVEELVPTRNHTEQLLPLFGVPVSVDGASVTVQPSTLTPPRAEVVVPGDFSSAAFWLVAGAIVPDSRLHLRGVGLNPTRIAALHILQRMGASIEIRPEGGDAQPGEPMGDLIVRSSALRGTTIDGVELAQAIDELPILMVAACLAEGRTLIREASELRVKETDRIVSMVTGLSRLGARLQVEGDDILIEGGAALQGCEVDSFGDHRTAMSLLIAGLTARGTTTVHGVECIAISYPGFLQTLEELGC